jgi:alpha-1,3-rhamnosyl/mannosyltransferase
MRIGIDASWAAALGTGTGSYTLGLVRALVQHDQHEFVLYFRPGDDIVNPLFGLGAPNVRRRVVDGWRQPGRSLIALARAAFRDGLEVYHSPGYFLPLWRGPKVVTFHDVNMFLMWTKWWRPGMRTSWAGLCAQTVIASRLATRIVADSNDAARQIGRVLRVPRRRISVLYPGVDEIYFDASLSEDATKLRERHELAEYVLSVGVLSPQKNLEGIVRAFALSQPGSAKLAIVGREDGPYFRQQIMPLVVELGIKDKVKVLGVVPRAALPALYSGATAFLYPSHAEGFGLPPLEAMARGVPVLASDRSSLPEVLEDAALLVNPDDVEAIAAGVCRLYSDAALRADLSDRGRRQAAKFRWRASALRALQVYASVA